MRYRNARLTLLLIALPLLLAACGGGGCDAGRPTFGNQTYDCPEDAPAPAPAASAASAP